MAEEPRIRRGLAKKQAIAKSQPKQDQPAVAPSPEEERKAKIRLGEAVQPAQARGEEPAITKRTPGTVSSPEAIREARRTGEAVFIAGERATFDKETEGFVSTETQQPVLRPSEREALSSELISTQKQLQEANKTVQGFSQNLEDLQNTFTNNFETLKTSLASVGEFQNFDVGSVLDNALQQFQDQFPDSVVDVNNERVQRAIAQELRNAQNAGADPTIGVARVLRRFKNVSGEQFAPAETVTVDQDPALGVQGGISTPKGVVGQSQATTQQVDNAKQPFDPNVLQDKSSFLSTLGSSNNDISLVRKYFDDPNALAEIVDKTSADILSQTLINAVGTAYENDFDTQNVLANSAARIKTFSEQSNSLIDKSFKFQTEILSQQKQIALDESNLSKMRLESEKEKTMAGLREKQDRMEGYLKSKMRFYGVLDSSTGLSLLAKNVQSFNQMVAETETDFNLGIEEFNLKSQRIQLEYTNAAIGVTLDANKQKINLQSGVNTKLTEIETSAVMSRQQKRVAVQQALGNFNNSLLTITSSEKANRLKEAEISLARESELFDRSVKMSGLTGSIWVSNAEGEIINTGVSTLDGKKGSKAVIKSDPILGGIWVLSESGQPIRRIEADGSTREFAGGGFGAGALNITPSSGDSLIGGVVTGEGNRPQRNNNPGNVKVGGIGDEFALKDEKGRPIVDDQGHLVFPDANAGFEALTSDLTAKIDGRTTNRGIINAANQLGGFQNMTISGLNGSFDANGNFVAGYAEDQNWSSGVTQSYNNITGTGITRDTKVSQLNKNALTQAIAMQEGFFAGEPVPTEARTEEDVIRLAQSKGMKIEDPKIRANVLANARRGILPEGRPIPATQATNLGEAAALPAQILSVQELLDDPESADLFTLAAIPREFMIWDAEAQKASANMRRVTQLVGSYMEGGVLRKEDEIKYRKMLPKVGDLKEVAQAKLEGVKEMLKIQYASQIDALNKGGFNVSEFNPDVFAGTDISKGSQSLASSFPPEQVGQWRSQLQEGEVLVVDSNSREVLAISPSDFDPLSQRFIP